MNLADYMIEPTYTVVDAIKKIDSNAKGIVYVCENDILDTSPRNRLNMRTNNVDNSRRPNSKLRHTPPVSNKHMK